MLILRRRPGELLELSLSPQAPADLRAADLFRDGPILIWLANANGASSVQLGIEAPQSVTVRRAELRPRVDLPPHPKPTPEPV